MRRLVAAIATLLVAALVGYSAIRPANSNRVPPDRPFANGMGTLPLAFEPNLGQADSPVKFLAHGSHFRLFLTSTGATLSLGASDGSGRLATSRSPSGSSTPAATDLLEMAFVGADPSVRAVGSERLPGLSHYFIGRDPGGWRTRVPHYGTVSYRNLYPGIDLTFHGNEEGHLEYDFTLASGTVPSLIHLAFQGANSLSLDSSGDLALDVGDQTVLQRKPLIYQLRGGDRQVISGGYVLEGPRVGFSVGAFDRTRPLIIDPEVEYSTFLGGSGDELGDQRPAADGRGHVYICGNTDSADFPITDGAYQSHIKGGFDAFVTEMNSDGSGLVYSTYLGGSGGFDLGIACALDGNGNLYLTGVTDSSDFPITEGVVQQKFGGVNDGFLAKLSPGGSTLLYSTYIGGNGDETLGDVKVDRSGNAFLAGWTSSTDFPVTPGAYQTSNAGGQDAVVVKVNPTATGFVYSTYLGGPTDDSGDDLPVAIDAAGDAYVSGVTNGDFPTTPGAFQRHYGRDGDVFVTKLDPTGSRLVYSTYLGGSRPEFFPGLTVDGGGNAYVAGATCSTNFPVTPHAYQKKNAGHGPNCYASVTNDLLDGFVTKINAQGSALVFSTYLGGSGPEFPAQGDPQIDGAGHVFVGGLAWSTDFPLTRDAFQRTNYGGVNGVDGTISELTSDGSGLIFSTYWGGTGDDGVIGSVLDASGNLYITGCTASSEFRTTPGVFQRTFAGGDGTGFGACGGSPADAFVTKIQFDNEDHGQPQD